MRWLLTLGISRPADATDGVSRRTYPADRSFAVMLLFLLGIVGGRKGTVILALLGSFIVYRPFCQFICPFGFISGIAERGSIFCVGIGKDRCAECGLCIKTCPSEAAKGRVHPRRVMADCFSCAPCLNDCPVDAIPYAFFFKKRSTKPPA